MSTTSAEHSHLIPSDRRPPSSYRGRAATAEPVHIPLNRKRIIFTLGGALLALGTVIALIVGMVRADKGIEATDGVGGGPALKAGEVQRVPNLPSE